MSSKLPIIAIVGATGAQGGSVAKSVLTTGKWSVRALTRNTDSAASKALAAQGAVPVKCDLDSQSDLANAFKDATVVYALTNFWDQTTLAKGDLDFELRQGKAMADAAKNAGVKHMIWSSLADSEAISGGKINSHHFTNKFKVEEYIRKINLPATFVYAGFYMANLATHFTPKRDANGVVTWATAIDSHVGLPLAHPATDMGPLVVKILERWGTHPEGRRVPLCSETLTFPEIVAQYSNVHGGVKTSYKVEPIPQQARAALAHAPGGQIQLSMIAMLDFFNAHGYWGGVDKTPEWTVLESPTTKWADFCKDIKVPE